MQDFLPPVIFENGLYYELKGEQYYPCLLPPEPDGEEEQLALIVQQMLTVGYTVRKTCEKEVLMTSVQIAPICSIRFFIGKKLTNF